MSSTKITYPDKIDGISYYSSANANEVKDATNNNADILDTATTDIADIRRSTETATYTPYSALTNKRDHTIFVQTGAIGEDATVIIGDASQINDSVTVVVEGDYNANLIMTGLPAEQVFSKKSRYYIWDGFNWYIPMEGAKGDQGEQGIQGIQGEQGIQGLQGDQGIQGIQGVSVEWLGSFGVAPSSPTLNQAYYNIADGKSYVWDGDSWEQMTQDGVDGDGVAGEIISLTQAEMNLPPDNALWAANRIYISQTSNAETDFGIIGETLGTVVCHYLNLVRASQTFYEKLGTKSFTRGANNTAWSSWYEQWGSGNDSDLAKISGGNAFTGEQSTSGAIESGRGSGGVALTINDGYGNSNVTFNHKSGTPEQSGNAGRIQVNTDSSTGAFMVLGVKSGLTNGVAEDVTDVLKVLETEAQVLNNRILTVADEGTGNGLDADMLDGIHGSSFLRSNAVDSASGNLSFYGGIDTAGKDVSLSDGALVSSDADGAFADRTGSNIDHIWHDDSTNAWNFCSDTTYKNTGNSRLNAGAIYDTGSRVYSAANPPSASVPTLTSIWTGSSSALTISLSANRVYLLKESNGNTALWYHVNSGASIYGMGSWYNVSPNTITFYSAGKLYFYNSGNQTIVQIWRLD